MLDKGRTDRGGLDKEESDGVGSSISASYLEELDALGVKDQLIHEEEKKKARLQKEYIYVGHQPNRENT